MQLWHIIHGSPLTLLDRFCQALQIIGAFLFKVKYLLLVLNFEIEGQKDPTFANTFP